MPTPQKEAGPDGSSIKPVSSLLSHFENMGKDQPAQTHPTQPVQPSQPSSRTASPAPRPDRPREPLAITTTKEPPPIPKKPGLAPALSKEHGVWSPARSAFPPPPLTPRPVLDAPELIVEPPRSPPKGRSPNIGGNDGSFLNPDDVVKPIVVPAPMKQKRISSRPSSKDRGISPITKPAFKPPSPPPPRRSAELRRQREDIPARPSLDSPRFKRSSWVGDATLDVVRANAADKVSPFNSPPSSASPGGDSSGGNSPPALPRRPRDPVPTAHTIQIGFAAPERPPVHPATANRRREKDLETNGSVREQLTPDITGDARPLIPPRPQSIIFEKSGTSLEKIPPPRPPRPMSKVGPAMTTKQMRHVSTPLHSLAPMRGGLHGRSNTVSHRNNDWSHSRQTALLLSPTNPRGEEVATAPLKPTDSIGAVSTAYPDASRVNRRPPHIRSGHHEIVTKSDPRNFDVSGDRVCASGHLTRVWSLRDGEMLMSFAHGEGLKATAVAFKPGANVDEEGKRLWIGNNNGDLIEADIETQMVVANRTGAHGRNEIIKIYRHFNELWSLDDSGTLHIWAPGDDHVPDMNVSSTQSFRVPRGQTFSMVVGDHLWHAAGKEIRVFNPSLDGKAQFQLLQRSLFQDSAGEITSGCNLPSSPDRVFFGHSDGKVSVYSRKDYSCLEILTVSTFKINTLQGICGNIWAGYSNGRICIYDINQSPWLVKKEWQAHDNPLIRLIADRSACYQLDRHQVLSLGADNAIRVWDGMLQEDWLEDELKASDVQYCQFDTLKAMIMTWNAGASTPNSLRYSDTDATFIQNLLKSSDCPDILIFGFQELVDLEDKTATAKRFFKSSKSKKKESEQERMSHQYRDWRDFLIRSLDDYMSGTLYHLLQTIHMVGLFTCVFVKSEVRDRISNLSTAEVKRGMGGLHGNKGTIVVRFMVDDTSLCFFNCHLAAGQTQAQSRNNDIAAILEAPILPVENNPSVRLDSYMGGGDGTMILDHELVIINGDLNYRIDTMSRDTVVMAVKQGNLSKLLERDQLLVARRRKPDFKLRIFEELPITFAPTYKYDVGTDNYDTSEKKRAPAWCDRLLFRGNGRIQQIDYLRHEVRVSDHRPVTGKFDLTVKRIKPKERAVAWIECQQRFEDVREREVYQEKLYYLTRIIGYDKETSKGLIEG